MVALPDNYEHVINPYAIPSADRRLRLVLSIFVLIFCATTVTAFSQEARHRPDFKSIVVFGDSLSDTGNVAHLTQSKYGFRIP